MPPELLNEVIHELCDEDDILNARKQTKHVIGLISLTCRHFAEPLRPTIFAHIRLKSRDDLLTLISFLDSPTSRIKDYIKEIEVKQYEPCEPWLHLLHTSLMCRLPHAKIERLSLISKESSPTAMKLRSIHGGSPRSIPPACWRIDDLRLDNLRLDSFGHMVKLVAGLPHLSHLECKKLVWPSVPPDSLPAPCRYNRGKEPWSLNVSMKNCAEHWPIFWFHPGISQIEPGDVRIMGRLIRCMLHF